MPFFNWDAPTMREVMAHRFWVYLAITLPMTVLVLGVVIAFIVYQVRMKKKDMGEDGFGVRQV